MFCLSEKFEEAHFLEEIQDSAAPEDTEQMDCPD
jgi:hypothetical protein